LFARRQKDSMFVLKLSDAQKLGLRGTTPASVPRVLPRADAAPGKLRLPLLLLLLLRRRLELQLLGAPGARRRGHGARPRAAPVVLRAGRTASPAAAAAADGCMQPVGGGGGVQYRGEHAATFAMYQRLRGSRNKLLPDCQRPRLLRLLLGGRGCFLLAGWCAPGVLHSCRRAHTTAPQQAVCTRSKAASEICTGCAVAQADA
jgi:hypothetical protein